MQNLEILDRLKTMKNQLLSITLVIMAVTTTDPEIGLHIKRARPYLLRSFPRMIHDPRFLVGRMSRIPRA